MLLVRPRDISGHHRPNEEEGQTGGAIKRMDNVGIVVEDMDAAIAFFVELGMELEGRAEVGGVVADQCTGLEGVRCDIAMVGTPDGHSRLELAKYRSPAMVGTDSATGRTTCWDAPRHVRRRRPEGTVASLRPHGAELVGEIARFEDSISSATSGAGTASSSGWPSSCAEKEKPNPSGPGVAIPSRTQAVKRSHEPESKPVLDSSTAPEMFA